MPALTIVQTTLLPAAHREFMAFLVGMQDLGYLGPVAIRQADDSFLSLAGNNRSQTFQSISHLLDERRITSFNLYTVGTCHGPQVDGWRPLFPELHKRMTVSDVGHSSSLLLFPTVTDGKTPIITAELIDRFQDLGEEISGVFVVSPEEASAPYLPGVPVLDATLIPHAAASTAVLAGLLDPIVAVAGETAPSPVIGQYRVVRPYVRLVNMDKMMDNLISAILDVDGIVGFEPDFDAALRVYPHPETLVKDATKALVDGHKLVYQRSRGFTSRQERSVAEALQELMRYIGRLLRRAPRSEVGDVQRGIAEQPTEILVQRIVTRGFTDSDLSNIRFPESTHDKHPDVLEQNIFEARQALIDEGGSENFLSEDPEVLPDRVLFTKLTDRGLKLLDGWVNDDKAIKPVGDAEYIIPAMSLDRNGHLETSTVRDDAINVGYGLPLAWDPGELARRVLDLKHDFTPPKPKSPDPGITEEDDPPQPTTPDMPAPENGRKTDLENLTAASQKAFVTRVGRRIFNSRTQANIDFMSLLQEMADDTAVGDGVGMPETKTNLRLSVLGTVTLFAAGTVGWATATGRLNVVQTTSVSAAIFLLVGLALTLIAIGYEAACLRREKLWGPRGARRRQLRDTWTAIHRYGALYREYLDWATIIGGYLLHPVGRAGNLIEYGSQASRPRWLVTAQNVQFSDGCEARLRRSIFARGWRGACFDRLIGDLSEEYRVAKDYDTVDPYDDLYDTRGARRELVGSAIPTAALGADNPNRRLEVRKRQYFVAAASDRILSLSRQSLAEPENIERVTAGRESHDGLDDFFGVLAADRQRQIFAGFLFPPDGTNVPIEVKNIEDSIVSAPRTQMGEKDPLQRIPSERTWPLLCSARIDFSPLADPVRFTDDSVIDLTHESAADIPSGLD
ncbi:MAG: hypothetical protein ACRBK7_23360 [Acidimicrobiales bacterium]